MDNTDRYFVNVYTANDKSEVLTNDIDSILHTLNRKNYDEVGSNKRYYRISQITGEQVLKLIRMGFTHMPHITIKHHLD